MQIMKLSTRFVIVFMLTAVLLSACIVGGRNALIGKWTPEKATAGQPVVTLEYTAGGKFRQETDGIVTELTYQFLSDSTVRIIVPESQGGSSNMDFKVTGDRLDLIPIDPQTQQPGAAITFVRVK
jgi:hypothetical protein